MADTHKGSDHVTEALRTQVRRMRERSHTEARSRDHPTDSVGGIDTGPASTYEVVTRHMVEGLADELREIRNRINTLIFALVGGILLDILSRIMNL